MEIATYLKKRIQTNLRLVDVVSNAVFRQIVVHHMFPGV